jgi:hypothetical protein
MAHCFRLHWIPKSRHSRAHVKRRCHVASIYLRTELLFDVIWGVCARPLSINTAPRKQCYATAPFASLVSSFLSFRLSLRGGDHAIVFLALIIKQNQGGPSVQTIYCTKSPFSQTQHPSNQGLSPLPCLLSSSIWFGCTCDFVPTGLSCFTCG